MPEVPGGVPMPPHAYIPGVNSRHPEGWFDDIKSGVTSALSPAALHHTQAWSAGWAYLEAGYYWECHEVLESVWLHTPTPSAERDLVQALIQLANARLKIRMQRYKAARRLCGMVRAHLERCPQDRPILGVSVETVAEMVRDTEQRLFDENRAI